MCGNPGNTYCKRCVCLLQIEFHQPTIFGVFSSHEHWTLDEKWIDRYRMLKVKLLNKQGQFHGADEISQAATMPQQWITTNRWTKEINSILFWNIFTALRLVISILSFFSEYMYFNVTCLLLFCVHAVPWTDRIF